MPINLNAKERLKEKAITVKLSMDLEDIYKPKIQKLIKDSFYEAAQVLEDTGDTNSAGLSTLRYQLRLADLLKEMYKVTGNVFSSRIFNRINRKSHNKTLETKSALTMYDLLFNEWIESESFAQAQLITETTRSLLVQSILNAQQENLTNSTVASLIREELGDLVSISRAETIARTEIHNAATFSSLESTKALSDDLDLEMRKVWLAVDDSRTRESHNLADDQQVDIKGFFNVGGKKMERPHDPRGGASEVINCRCTMSFETDELELD